MEQAAGGGGGEEGSEPELTGAQAAHAEPREMGKRVLALCCGAPWALCCGQCSPGLPVSHTRRRPLPCLAFPCWPVCSVKGLNQGPGHLFVTPLG